LHSCRLVRFVFTWFTVEVVSQWYSFHQKPSSIKASQRKLGHVFLWFDIKMWLEMAVFGFLWFCNERLVLVSFLCRHLIHSPFLCHVSADNDIVCITLSGLFMWLLLIFVFVLVTDSTLSWYPHHWISECLTWKSRLACCCSLQELMVLGLVPCWWLIHSPKCRLLIRLGLCPPSFVYIPPPPFY
jgi:hypothetical protein